jgi:hypothetical protein
MSTATRREAHSTSIGGGEGRRIETDCIGICRQAWWRAAIRSSPLLPVKMTVDLFGSIT